MKHLAARSARSGIWAVQSQNTAEDCTAAHPQKLLCTQAVAER